MRVLLATLLSLLVGTAAGQCDTAGYTQCLAEHLSSANPNKCATAGFTGDAMCACQAQSAVCAKRFKCPEMCETTMTALSCGAAWCKVSNVSKPIRFTTVYRFTKEITNSQLWSLIVKNLSPAINTNWVSITDVVDTSVQTPSPTLPNDITRDDVNKGCPKLNFASDCEGAMTFGLCRWTGTACVPSGKKLPSEAPTRGGSESGSESGSGSEVPVPAPSGDIRGMVCKILEAYSMDYCPRVSLCVASDGKCGPSTVPFETYCQGLKNETTCKQMRFGIVCEWKGNACVKGASQSLPTSPADNKDVRPGVCEQSQHPDLCSRQEYCVQDGGRCVPSPTKPSVPAFMACPVLTQVLCTNMKYQSTCMWKDSKCQVSDGSGSEGAPTGPVDVRIGMCEVSGMQGQCTSLVECVEQDGKCKPNPSEDALPADVFCPTLADEVSCTFMLFAKSCSWSGSACEMLSTARVAAVLAGGPWEATVKVEIKKEDSASPDVYMNDALVAQLPNQMDTMATTGDFKSYGATVEQSTVSEKANEGTAGGGGSDGMSTGAIIGIVAGCLVGIALVGVVGFMVVKRKDTANMNSPSLVGDYQDMQKATGPNDYANMQTI
eukprot:TRINITY_DN787_c0_g2_i7.p1 TRINITY_DN787_c0_g2~~TRINITY_DN787_c0_g2_i7.p1  ORF type:complete len:612 (+),score=167.15 TRINITY_DN787_c0_g2_i7:23-1837(+)